LCLYKQKNFISYTAARKVVSLLIILNGEVLHLEDIQQEVLLEEGIPVEEDIHLVEEDNPGEDNLVEEDNPEEGNLVEGDSLEEDNPEEGIPVEEDIHLVEEGGHLLQEDVQQQLQLQLQQRELMQREQLKLMVLLSSSGSFQHSW